MNRADYEEAKKAQQEITLLLKADGLSPEEKKKFEIINAQLSGQLFSIWFPFDWSRRLIIITLLLLGFYGFSNGNNYLMLAWVVMLTLSPRVVGELSFFLGKIFR